MNESLVEYLRLREHLHGLLDRQGPAAWFIIERAVAELAEYENGKTDAGPALTLDSRSRIIAK